MLSALLSRPVLLGVAVLYVGAATWFLIRAHEPAHTPVRFDALTQFHEADKRGDRKISTHAYLKWSERKADTDKKGVTIHDREAACPGYNLFTDDRQHALLVDMDGEVVYSWTWEGAHWLEYALVEKDGTLLGMSVREGVAKLDKDSNKLWEVKGHAHHEIAIDLDGTIIVPTKRVFEYGGRDPSTRKQIALDELDFVSPAGKLVARWSMAKDFQEYKKLHKPSPADEGKEDDYYHLNSVQVLPDTELGRRDARFREGNYLLCLRNVNLLLILDRETMKTVWHWGVDDLDYPHMPRLLPNGTMLVYDNGPHRKTSRILEIDPTTNKVVWKYESESPRFYSGFRGSNQRLPNGNTLICESDSGRVLEVDRSGRIVWEFWNPIFNKQGRRRGIYRVERVSPEHVAAFLPTRGLDWALIGAATVPLLILLGAAFVGRRRGGSRSLDAEGD